MANLLKDEERELLNYFGLPNIPDEKESTDELKNEEKYDYKAMFQIPVKGNPTIIGTFAPGVYLNPTHPHGHNGVDYQANKGTPVYPIASGIVSNVGYDKKGGNFVTTKHNNVGAYYAHLDSILVERGQLINEKTTIGTVGNSGNARQTSPHLHLEIRENGQLVNPLSVIGKSINASASLKIEARKKILKLILKD